MRRKKTTSDSIEALRNREGFMTTSEVMELLQVKSRHTITGWVQQGVLPATRLPNNSYIFQPSVLADWLRARTTGVSR